MLQSQWSAQRDYPTIYGENGLPRPPGWRADIPASPPAEPDPPEPRVPPPSPEFPPDKKRPEIDDPVPDVVPVPVREPPTTPRPVAWLVGVVAGPAGRTALASPRKGWPGAGRGRRRASP